MAPATFYFLSDGITLSSPITVYTYIVLLSQLFTIYHISFLFIFICFVSYNKCLFLFNDEAPKNDQTIDNTKNETPVTLLIKQMSCIVFKKYRRTRYYHMKCNLHFGVLRTDTTNVNITSISSSYRRQYPNSYRIQILDERTWKTKQIVRPSWLGLLLCVNVCASWRVRRSLCALKQQALDGDDDRGKPTRLKYFFLLLLHLLLHVMPQKNRKTWCCPAGFGRLQTRLESNQLHTLLVILHFVLI